MPESWGEIESDLKRRSEMYDLNHLLKPPPPRNIMWDITNINKSNNDQLSEILSYTGSYIGYLNAELALLEGTYAAVKSSTSVGISKAMAELERDATKRRLKDGMYAEAIESSEELRLSKWREIELEAQIKTATGYRDAYQILWQTASREQTRRQGEMEHGLRGTR